MSTLLADQLATWQRNPVAFVEEVLRNPDTGAPFVLYPVEERFLREAFTLRADGRLPYEELVFSGPKKSGKTALGAFALLYATVVLGGPNAEGYAVANDLEQAQGRVFRAASRIVEASPLLRRAAKVYTSVIEFPGSGAVVTALASDYAGAAGANPTITVFDELWAYSGERAHRLWDELVPVPTRKVSVRLTVTYAGFEGESNLLEGLYTRGLRGKKIAPALYRQPGLLMFWSHEPVAPWQTPAWKAQMRKQLRPNAYLRMIENKFVSGEERFIPDDTWDACVDHDAAPLLPTKAVPLVVGVDAATKRDAAAVVAVSRQGERVQLAWHRIWQPNTREVLDLEETLEAELRDRHRDYWLTAVYYDPMQFVRSAQTLQKLGLPMVEWPQSEPNITRHSQTLFDLLNGRSLQMYPDKAMRTAALRAVAKETPRGWKIAKEKTRHKIDVIVALAMACMGAVHEAAPLEGKLGDYVLLGPRRSAYRAPSADLPRLPRHASEVEVPRIDWDDSPWGKMRR